MFFTSLALGYVFVVRSDEMIASPTGEGHPVHCLTRGDVALYGGGGRLISLQWHHQATSVEVRSRGHKGDQAQQGSDIVRTRDDAWGPRHRRSYGGIAVWLSDIAGKVPRVVVSAR